MSKKFKERRLILFFIVLLMICHTNLFSAETTLQLFSKANNLFEQGDYKEAISLYEKLLAEKSLAGEQSGHLYYNLGNSYYREGKIGLSLFYLSKARELLPREADVLYNYEFVSQRSVDKVGTEFSLNTFIERMSHLLPLNLKEYLYLTSLLFILFFSIKILMLWKFKESSFLIWSKRLTLLLFFFLFFGTLTKYFWIYEIGWGNVVSEQVEVYSGVGKDNIALFTLHEGSFFYFSNANLNNEKWVQIILRDGKKGWAKSSALALSIN